MVPRFPDGAGYPIHPGLLDTCFQMIGGFGEADPDEEHLLVPVRIENLRLYRKPSSGGLWCLAQKDANDAKPAAPALSGSLRLMDETGELLVSVEGFHLEKARREIFLPRTSAGLREALYEVHWQISGSKRVDPADTEGEPGRGGWLLFADQTGIAGELAERLRAHGEAAISVTRESRFTAHAIDRYGVNPETPADFGRLFRAIGKPPKGMIFLWGLDLGQAVDEEAILRAEIVCGGVSAAVRAIGESDGGRPGPFWVVTRGAQPVGKGPVAALQAMLWGIGAVLDVEHPELCARCMDLAPFETEAMIPMLLEELLHPDAENRIALRPEGRYIARLERRAESVPDGGFGFEPDAGYLITGGLGDLGLAVADWMGRNGARHLMLTGRNAPSAPAAETIARIEQTGCEVLVVNADVASQEDVNRLMKEIDARMPPLCGIVHAAGVTDDAVISRLERERFRTVMAPKVRGTWNLHAATAEKPLDFFVCFSSAAAIMGAGGQANYAAANAFMDALAHERHRQGLRGLSINWGAWGDIGMAARMKAELRERVVAQGMGDMAPEQGLHLLGGLLRGEATQALVMAVDWDRYLSNRYPKAPPPFFNAVSGGRAAPGKPGDPVADFAGLLNRMPAGERHGALLDYLRSQVAATLGMASPEQLEPRQRLFDIGMDSLMAVELKNRLESGLGMSLRSTLVFDYPTLEALMTHLSEDRLTPLFPPAPAEAERAPSREEDEITSLLLKIEAMTDQELRSMFTGGKSKPAGSV
jgi:NAD(P)-dependent dehydrogenase (short-subunit alcohol dehydrogenase family)/acyl carrier protein